MNLCLLLTACVTTICSSSDPDDLYLRTGFAFKNVRVVDTVGSTVSILYDGRIRRIPSDVITFYDHKPFDSLVASSLVEYSVVVRQIDTTIAPVFVIDSAARRSIMADIRTSITSKQPQTPDPMRSLIAENQRHHERPKLYLLVGSVLAVTIAYDSFVDAGDLDDTIANFKKLSPPYDTVRWEKQRFRKNFVGVIAVGVAVVNTIFALERIEIRGDNTSVTLSYAF